MLVVADTADGLLVVSENVCSILNQYYFLGETEHTQEVKLFHTILVSSVDVFCRERLAYEYDSTGDLLVELGSDQTSCHNPFLGGYYPAQVGL